MFKAICKFLLIIGAPFFLFYASSAKASAIANVLTDGRYCYFDGPQAFVLELYNTTSKGCAGGAAGVFCGKVKIYAYVPTSGGNAGCADALSQKPLTDTGSWFNYDPKAREITIYYPGGCSSSGPIGDYGGLVGSFTLTKGGASLCPAGKYNRI